MAITNPNPRNPYTGDGTKKVYDYQFRIIKAEFIRALVLGPNESTPRILLLNIDYTVSGVGNQSGQITLLDSDQDWIDSNGFLAGGWKLLLRSFRSVTQDFPIRNEGPFFREIHENALDEAIKICQQQQNEIDRSLRLAETLTPSDFDPVLPAVLPPNSILHVNATGDAFEFVSGETFVSGSKFFNGSGAPAGGLGSDGDLYLDVVDPFTLYKKIGGIWTIQATLKGGTGATGPSGAEYTVDVRTGNFNAVPGVRHLCNTTAAAFTATLPAAPADGDIVAFKDTPGTFNTNPLTIGRNGKNIEGLAADFVCRAAYEMRELQYSSTLNGWFFV